MEVRPPIKQGKGSNDPIKMVNKYGILDDDMETT